MFAAKVRLAVTYICTATLRRKSRGRDEIKEGYYPS
jgi:hypothetical protein